MRKLLLIALALGVCGSALAGPYMLRRFVVSNVATSATATTVSVTGITGKPVAFSWLGATNMNVSLATTAGIGISPSALTIVASTNSKAFYRPLPEGGAQYLYNDEVTLTATNSSDTNAASGGVGLLLLEQP